MLAITMGVPLNVLLNRSDMALLAQAGIRYLCPPCSFYEMGEERVREEDRALREAGFTIDTCHPPFGGGNQPNSLCAEDEDVRRETVRTYTRFLRACGWTGVRAVPVHTGGAMHAAGGPKALDRLTDTLRQILPAARDSGVILALENTFYPNPCPFSDAPDPSGVSEEMINDDCAMLRRYVDEWSDPNIMICHDAGHSLLYGHDLFADLDALADRTALYHIHDNDGVRDVHWNVGEGVFPWARFTAFLRGRGGHPWPLYDEVLADKSGWMTPTAGQIVGFFRQAQKTLAD